MARVWIVLAFRESSLDKRSSRNKKKIIIILIEKMA